MALTTVNELLDALDISRTGFNHYVLRKYGIKPTTTYDNKPLYETVIEPDYVEFWIAEHSKWIMVQRTRAARIALGRKARSETLRKRREAK